MARVYNFRNFCAIFGQFYQVFVLFEILELFEYFVNRYSIFELQLFLLESETLGITPADYLAVYIRFATKTAQVKDYVL